MVNIGVSDKILVEFSTFEDRFVCVVTDLARDGRIFAYAPVPEKVIKRLRTDSTVFVRYAHEGVLHGFKSRVLNRVESKSTVLELAAPSHVVEAEERSEPRCACSFPAYVVEDGRAAEAVVEDMSKSCSRVRFLNEGLFLNDETGNELRLKFHPFDTEDGYSVGCTLCKAFQKDGEHYAVLQFNADERDARRQIARFIEAQVCCGIPRI